ncbi:transporter [Marivirga sp.]|uniref:transporter n=1 Tax=Marivirga sp. TaxID=2018662 RepID=UPI0025F2D48D|nr:transporter [Marivirga sp.]
MKKYILLMPSRHQINLQKLLLSTINYCGPLTKISPNKSIYLFIIGLFISTRLQAQTPSDALMMKSNQLCILLDYNYSSFDHYWEGELRRNNETIAMVKRNSVMPMVAIGIFDDLNFYAGVPYIKTESTEPNGGKFAGASGFQDLSIALKYRWLNKQFEKGELSGLATIGFSTPITNYLPDYMPYSIGSGAPELSYRAIVEYKNIKDWYFRGAGTYLWRGYAEAERDYYYNNGSYYTPWMDVPNAFSTEFVVGKWLFSKSLQIQVSYFGSKSLSGDDIRPYNPAQPTNKVNIDRIGIFSHYFFANVTGLGIVVYHNRIVAGRNAPHMNTTGMGLTYYFNYRK